MRLITDSTPFSTNPTVQRVLKHSLKIKDLSLQVHLGCTDEERAIQQEIRISINMDFTQAPFGVQSDNLNDTICYAKICEALKMYVKNQEFRLVENLCNEIYKVTEKIIAGRARIFLSLHKVNPPIEGLLGGVEYRMESP